MAKSTHLSQQFWEVVSIIINVRTQFEYKLCFTGLTFRLSACGNCTLCSTSACGSCTDYSSSACGSSTGCNSSACGSCGCDNKNIEINKHCLKRYFFFFWW